MRAVNLIPSEQRSGASVGAGRSEGGAYAVLALIAGVAVLALLYGSASHQLSGRRTQAAALSAQAQQAQSAAEQLAPYTSFVALREQRTQAVATLAESRFDWAHVLHEFGRVLPSGVTISSLGGTIGASADATVTTTSAAPATSSTPGTSGTAAAAAPTTSATPAGSIPTFTLTGCATSQSTVALTLGRLRLIDGVKEVTLQSSTSSGAAVSSADGCTGHYATFGATVVFDPLATTSAVAAVATKTVSDPTGASSAAASSPSASTTSAATTTSTGVAR
jgi:Tfp pilus assembly protein PilN